MLAVHTALSSNDPDGVVDCDDLLLGEGGEVADASEGPVDALKVQSVRLPRAVFGQYDDGVVGRCLGDAVSSATLLSITVQVSPIRSAVPDLPWADGPS